jgi:ribose 5-phosphate isomerase A
MASDLSPLDRAKYAAARRAVDFVEDGMRLGLGTGSTAVWMLRCLGRRVREEGLRITGVPTSTQTARLAAAEGIELTTLSEAKWLDLTIDGTDEFDARLDLIKGGGGALLQEKIVATASERMLVIADAAKEVATLGAFALPVEVVDFGWQTTQALIEDTLASLDVLGNTARLRMREGQPFRTDQGNLILDLDLRRIGNPRQVSLVLNQIPGVVENGLFIDICDRLVIGYGDGRFELRDALDGGVEQGRVELPEAQNLFRDVAE